MPRRATVSGGVRGGASRARDAGQGAFDRLTQSLDAAQAALNDLRKELSKGTRDVLQDLDTTLKDARKSARRVSRTVTKDLEQIQHALATGKPAEPRAARARRTAARPTTGRKTTTAAKAAPARKRPAAGARAMTARATKPTAAAGEQRPRAAATAEKEIGSAAGED
jgi:hypothetical protein